MWLEFWRSGEMGLLNTSIRTGFAVHAFCLDWTFGIIGGRENRISSRFRE